MPDREKYIEALSKAVKAMKKYYFSEDIPILISLEFAKGILKLLKEQKTVVRCKNCKYATMTADGKMCKYCEMDTDDSGDQREVYHDANWFCADGKRR